MLKNIFNQITPHIERVYLNRKEGDKSQYLREPRTRTYNGFQCGMGSIPSIQAIDKDHISTISENDSIESIEPSGVLVKMLIWIFNNISN